MRSIAWLVCAGLAGCYDPRIVDGGFACSPRDAVPCPSGFVCRARRCVSPESAAAAPVTPADDLAVASAVGDMAAPANDLAPASECGVAQLVINEVQTHGRRSNDQWIELYNPCSVAVSLRNFMLVYRSHSAIKDIYTLAMIDDVVDADGYYVIADSGHHGNADIKPFNEGSLDETAGGVAIRDDSGAIIDSIAWGHSDNGFAQGQPATACSAGSSMARLPNGVNTHDDSVDFRVTQSPTPGAANR
jgi:hypothetical protein